MTASRCAPVVAAGNRRRAPVLSRTELAYWMLTLLIGGAIAGAPVRAQSADPGAHGSQGTSGTQPAPSLTVDDICRLVQAGISEDLIIAKLRKNGKAFDLSTDELLKLKKAGVTDRILNVMMDPGQPAPAPAAVPPATLPAAGALAPGTAVPGTPAPATPAPGIPDEVGVYWTEHNGELHRIEGIAVSNMRTGSTFASRMTLGIKRMRINAQLNGPHAQLRIKERQPQFYFYLPEDASIGDYLLLRLAQRSDVRQIEIGEKTMWKEQAGVDHAKEVSFTYKRVKNRLYLLSPNSELDLGEYGFYIASGVELKKATGRIYDFGID